MAVDKIRYPEGMPEVLPAPEKPQLRLVQKMELKEVRRGAIVTSVTAVYFCRACQEKKTALDVKLCDCGLIMCNQCWTEWDDRCPLCETDLS